MSAIELSPFVNHLWQSTLFAAAAILLTLVLRENHARTRYWLWLAASVKFLIPFSLMVAVGSRFEWRSVPALAPQVSLAMEQIGQPFAIETTWAISPKAPFPVVLVLLLAVWLCGFAAVVTMWWRRSRGIRRAMRVASPCRIDLRSVLPPEARAARWTGRKAYPTEILSSPMLLEPGVFGIFRPVLLLPEGIAERLTPAQLRAIVAHELCHVRRRDNLTAAIQMVVEAIFWFHPLVWWIGARMVEERERACDEEVLQMGNEPETYAEGILNVCKFYVQSPLTCAAGVTGSDLKKRIEAIMNGRPLRNLNFGRKLLLTTVGIVAVAAPVAIGVLHAPRILAWPQDAGPAFEVATVKPNKSGALHVVIQRGQGYLGTNVTLQNLIAFAYDVRPNTLTGAPGWIDTERFDVVAKAAPGASDEQRKRMMQTLLAERFKLVVHRDKKEMPIYALVVAKNGPKLKPSQAEETEFGGDRGRFICQNVRMAMFARQLQRSLGRPVVDQTGLTGAYDFKLEWTPDEGAAAPVSGEERTAATDQRGPSLFTALQEQLGLKLESRKGPVEILVVDRVERVPAEN